MWVWQVEQEEDRRNLAPGGKGLLPVSGLSGTGKSFPAGMGATVQLPAKNAGVIMRRHNNFREVRVINADPNSK
jgi:hypothetical protein